ncbi:hypothetical protein [Aliikangiella maris]|uniref:Uncharacterized protein n=2 Tax=Aliikangiella maris TaxID=3162458 RepID=A0ABV2BWX6_9GAMM
MSDITSPMSIILTNNNGVNLSLISCEITASSAEKELKLAPTIDGYSTDGGYGTPASRTPYQVKWTYSPDGGSTLLTFDCRLSGESGITIIPSKSGPLAEQWIIGESPILDRGIWIVRFSYSAAS